MNKHMIVYLTASQWKELKVDKNLEFVRAAFYLALPYTYIAHRVRFVSFEADRNSVIESAHDLGITPEDKIVLLPGS